MAKVSVECPGCFAKLNLSDRSKLGKKIKCPKCAEVFLAEAPDDEDEDEFLEDEFERPAKPSGGRKRPTSGGGKKSDKQSGGNQGLLIGGGIAAVVVFLVAGLYFAGVFGGAKPQPAAVAGAAPAPAPAVAVAAPNGMSPAEKTLALRWMPAETELILHVKLAEIWKAPLLKGLVENPQTVLSMQELQKYVGLGPADIDSITIGMTDLKGIQSASMMAAMGMPPAASQFKGLIVVRSRQPVSQSAILQANPNLKSIDHNGKSYCELSQPQPQAGGPGSAPSVGAWVADANTVVIGGAEELKGAMDRGETVTPRKELMFADAAPHVVLVVAPKDLQALRQNQSPTALPGVPPQIAEMQKSINESMQGVGIGLNIRGGFDFQTSFLLKDATDVAKVKSGLEAALVEGRKQFEVTKATVPPLLGDLGQMLLDNLKFDEQSPTVKVSSSIPDSAQQQLEQLPPLMMMMMAMSGGLNPATARPGNSPIASPGGATKVEPASVIPAVPENPNVPVPQPIEAKTVQPVKVEGLPDGVTLSLNTAWGLYPTLNSASKTIQPIELLLNVEGSGLDQICGFGPFAVKTLTLADGKGLKVARAVRDLTKLTLPFGTTPIYGSLFPAGKLRAPVAVEPPTDSSANIAVFEGTLKLMTTESTQEYVVEDAPKKALRALADPGLKAAGVKLLLDKSDGINGETLVLSCGKQHMLGVATATTPGNDQTRFFVPEYEKGQTVQKLRAFDGSKTIPSNLHVKIVVHLDFQEDLVSFRFEEAALPSIESKPASQAP